MIITAAPDPVRPGVIDVSVDPQGQAGTLSIVREDVLSGETKEIASGIPVGGNLLDDPSFESGVGDFNDGSGGTHTSDTTHAHTGTHSLKIVSAGFAAGSAARALGSEILKKPEPGKYYTFSWWIYIPSGTTAATTAGQLLTSDTFEGPTVTALMPAERDQWVKVSTPPVLCIEDLSPSYQLTLYAANAAGHEVWHDDVVLAEYLPDTWEDTTPPFGRPLIYRADLGGGNTAVSDPITLTPTQPVVSDPEGSLLVAASIYDWPELQFQTQSKIIRVPGRRGPVVMLDVEQTPSSTVTFITRTQADLLAFRQLVAGGEPLLVRSPCPGVETATITITSRTERRRNKNGADWTRFHVCDVEHLEQS